MPLKNSYITITDQFCGAGGSSQGAKRALDRVGIGAEGIKLAMNHWSLAIETHNTNFPETLHDCTDVSACDPRRYPSTDILITSPECTTHSPAGGNSHKALKMQMDLFNSGKIDPATERSRATMWDVCRFAEYHSYNLIIVENVVEAKTRWPLFDVWLSAMHALGYRHRCVFLNSMHCHPTPQSRDRMYVVFWKAGNKAPNLDFMPAAHCPKCCRDVQSMQTWKDKRKPYGKYRKQYVYCCPTCSTIVEPYYYASFNLFDWSDLGTRIGDRKKPLVPKTIARIEYGLKKYGCQPLVVRNQTPGSCTPLSGKMGTVTTDDTHAILNPPFTVDNKQTTGIGFRVRGADDVTCTMHTEPGVGMLTPFVYNGSISRSIHPATAVKNTQTTCNAGALITPFLIDSAYGGRTHSVGEAKSAQTTQHTQGLVMMPVVPVARGKSKAHAAGDALSTQSQMINHGIVTAPLVTELRGTGKARPATRELNGITAGGITSGLITPESFHSFVSHVYGNSYTRTVTETIGTVRTKEAHGLISYQEPKLEDCYYRMLFPHEIQRAMAFADDYVILGSGKDKVKQCGNAVTPPVMEWLVERAIESLL